MNRIITLMLVVVAVISVNVQGVLLTENALDQCKDASIVEEVYNGYFGYPAITTAPLDIREPGNDNNCFIRNNGNAAWMRYETAPGKKFNVVEVIYARWQSGGGGEVKLEYHNGSAWVAAPRTTRLYLGVSTEPNRRHQYQSIYDLRGLDASNIRITVWDSWNNYNSWDGHISSVFLTVSPTAETHTIDSDFVDLLNGTWYMADHYGRNITFGPFDYSFRGLDPFDPLNTCLKRTGTSDPNDSVLEYHASQDKSFTEMTIVAVVWNGATHFAHSLQYSADKTWYPLEDPVITDHGIINPNDATWRVFSFKYDLSHTTEAQKVRLAWNFKNNPTHVWNPFISSIQFKVGDYAIESSKVLLDRCRHPHLVSEFEGVSPTFVGWDNIPDPFDDDLWLMAKSAPGSMSMIYEADSDKSFSLAQVQVVRHLEYSTVAIEYFNGVSWNVAPVTINDYGDASAPGHNGWSLWQYVVDLEGRPAKKVRITAWSAVEYTPRFSSIRLSSILQSQVSKLDNVLTIDSMANAGGKTRVTGSPDYLYWSWAFPGENDPYDNDRNVLRRNDANDLVIQYNTDPGYSYNWVDVQLAEHSERWCTFSYFNGRQWTTIAPQSVTLLGPLSGDDVTGWQVSQYHFDLTGAYATAVRIGLSGENNFDPAIGSVALNAIPQANIPYRVISENTVDTMKNDLLMAEREFSNVLFENWAVWPGTASNSPAGLDPYDNDDWVLQRSDYSDAVFYYEAGIGKAFTGLSVQLAEHNDGTYRRGTVKSVEYYDGSQWVDFDLTVESLLGLTNRTGWRMYSYVYDFASLTPKPVYIRVRVGDSCSYPACSIPRQYDPLVSSIKLDVQSQVDSCDRVVQLSGNLLGDMTADCYVDLEDFAHMSSQWLMDRSGL